MENIHVLPKNVLNQLGVDHYGKTPTQIKIAEFLININIYITNYEEIKDGEEIKNKWLLDKDTNKVFKCKNIIAASDPNRRLVKVILTTDQDLIKDGVQAIDDEFLEWFIKNPNYKKVEIETFFVPRKTIGYDFNYKIIIPKKKKKMKETLEKAAERLSKDAYKKHSLKDDTFSLDEQIQRRGGFIVGFTEGLKEGAKWQAERMYSEEELLSAFNAGYDLNTFEQLEIPNEEREYLSFKDWFEQFKKK
jgi:hypothetical protein